MSFCYMHIVNEKRPYIQWKYSEMRDQLVQRQKSLLQLALVKRNITMVKELRYVTSRTTEKCGEILNFLQSSTIIFKDPMNSLYPNEPKKGLLIFAMRLH